MRDPLEQLSSLSGDLPGALPGTPLPAEEVRRRGDRRRRRRTLVQAAGAVAAVAVVVAGGALVSTDLGAAPVPPGPAERTGAPSPSPTSSPGAVWLTSIPEGFALGRGLPEPGGDVPAWEWAEGPDRPLSAIACGDARPLPVSPVDGLRVEVAAPDESAWRHLLLFEDALAAAQAQRDLTTSAEGCSAGQQGGPGDRLGPEEVRWTYRSTAGRAPVLDVEGAFYAAGTDVRVPGRILTRVVQVGNALLVARLDTASSSSGQDAGAREFASALEAVAADLCVFAADPCGQTPDAASPDGDAPPYLLGADDLAAATGLSGWAVVDDGLDAPFLCAEEPSESLGSDRNDTVHFAVGAPGGPEALAVTMVMDFDPPLTTAADGYARAARWLASCAEPLDREHRVSSAGEPYGDLHTGRTEHGPWSWRTVMSTAPEICEECDAGWNNHQAALTSGGRLVMVQVSYRADLQSSVDESDSPFPDLIETAAALSARHPADSASGSGDLTLGPTSLGPVAIGMSLADLRGLVRGTPRHCAGFDAVDLPGPVDGYASGTGGVEALFAGPPVQTPEGVGFLDTRAEVEEVYGELTPSSVRRGWLAPVPDHVGLTYSFAFDETGRMTELGLLRDTLECLG